MNCNRIRIQLAAYVDGELGTAESLEMAAHVGACADCRRARAAQAFAQVEVRRQARRFAAPERLRRRIRGKLGL
jgi:anti-sigma factor RsiW